MLSRSRKAFTLLELIVVIVILGLLAALAIPTFQTIINKSKNQTAETSAASIGRNAVAISAIDGGGFVDATDLTAAVAEAPSGEVTFETADFVPGATEDKATATVTVNETDVTLTFNGRSVTAKVAPVVTP